MQITQIDVYQVSYRLLDRKYAWSRGHEVETLLSTVVRVKTDEGLEGFGEVCPLGSAYMDAYGRGVPSGIKEVAPLLLSQDPTQLNVINEIMDSALGGHNYVKSPLDIACWDILGQKAGLPICVLLGGCAQEKFPLYRAISQGGAEEMAEDVSRFREEGYRKFQLKVGGDPLEDIARIKAVLKVLEPGDVLVADANTGWLMHDAIRLANGIAGEDVYLEQPCRTLGESLTVRGHTALPMVLDEVIRDVGSLMEAYQKRAMDVVNLKISRLGGFTRAKLMRDICQSLGVAMTIEDSWGGDITTAAISHLAASTLPEFYFSSTDFNSYNDLSLADDAPRRKKGWLQVPQKPGLGIRIDERKLGEPLFTLKK
ncbi:MAG: cis-3-hydroxy-L-proline dehydratase [Candidatus Aminicenantales bacterium]